MVAEFEDKTKPRTRMSLPCKQDQLFLYLFIWLLLWGIGGSDAARGQDSVVAEPALSLPATFSESERYKELVAKLDSDTQALWLNAGNGTFLGLFTPASGANEQGAIILVADKGQHADWPGPVRQIRRQLPLHGWATLSIALPVHVISADSNDVNEDDEAQQNINRSVSEMSEQEDSAFGTMQANAELTQRLQSAMAQTQNFGLYNVVVLAVGDAALLTALSLAELPPSDYAGFIALGPWSLQKNEQASMAEIFTALPSAVLELLPGQWPEQHMVKRRGLAEKVQHSNYVQVKLLGNSSDFKHSPQLLPRIRGWLKRHAGSMEGRRQSTESS